jgi:hypothetical protein
VCSSTRARFTCSTRLEWGFSRTLSGRCFGIQTPRHSELQTSSRRLGKAIRSAAWLWFPSHPVWRYSSASAQWLFSFAAAKSNLNPDRGIKRLTSLILAGTSSTSSPFSFNHAALAPAALHDPEFCLTRNVRVIARPGRIAPTQAPYCRLVIGGYPACSTIGVFAGCGVSALLEPVRRLLHRALHTLPRRSR